jgi:hypothetical protein
MAALALSTAALERRFRGVREQKDRPIRPASEGASHGERKPSTHPHFDAVAGGRCADMLAKHLHEIAGSPIAGGFGNLRNR